MAVIRGARWAVAVVLVAGAVSAAAQDAADYFRTNCVSCHTIGGGRLTGPDLKDVESRKDRAWLVTYIQNPKAVIDSGDPYAAKLLEDARGVIMPTAPGMNAARAAALLDLIAAESKLPHSQFAGLEIPDKPFTAVDVAAGSRYFAGTARLANGGPSCISCHTVRGIGGLGGGRLGPDLTLVFERLGGRRNLATWLSAPATATMNPLFRGRALQPSEILPLTAYFEDAAKRGGQADTVTVLDFFLLGLGGAVICLASFGAAWKRRFRAVRRPLVRGER
ncbi:MAG: cytochrome c [Thermoanaerobaculaceae bacterium]|nr:cytochrome c [Thermoanaerobaculaceae bacterium]MDI9620951.1 cytochrome c [Acidobacteriota bacterium]HPW56424.1 cytochrome c [Thermoanaerobaculaceae bacterium]